VLIDEGDEECYEAIAELRPEGCLYKHTSQDELIAAVKTVFKGKKYMTPGFSHTPGNDTSSPGTSDNSRILRLLTNREKEILQHIINGKSKHEIANELFISANTVVTHRKKIMAKLGVNNTTRLILVSLKSGLIPLPD
jgi:DNA-binding NarL/FixJ family response regulator